MNKLKCAVKNCEKNALVSYGNKWICGKCMMEIINKETETIVATGVILAGIPCVDHIDISKIKTGDKLVLDATKATVDIKK